MFIFQGKGLRKEWEGQVIFQDVDIELKMGEHLAVFGRNGCGKTTLLNGLLGKINFDGGNIQCFVPRDEWGYLEQKPVSTLTVKEFVQSGSDERYQLKLQLDKLQSRLKESDSHVLLEKYGDLQDRFMQINGYELETDAEKCLREVELHDRTWNLPFECLSGGQKTRAQLAKILLKKPSCIFMDEPTNYLDRETMEWLENWFLHFKGAVLFVSHDRYFLDRTAQAIIELNPDGCNRYSGGYTVYREQKEIERKTRETLFKKQEQKRKELLESIRRYQQWFQQAHKAAGQNDFARAKAKKNVSRLHAKEKELERLEKESVDRPADGRQLNMRLDSAGFSARTLLRMEEVSFAYDDTAPLFQDLTFSVNRGDRIAVVGPNGSGKSTLLKLMLGQLPPSSGRIMKNPQTKAGYFAQELENLQQEQSILDSFLSIPGMTQSEARTLLGSFLFSRDDVFKKIGQLSMGEKCRIAFLKLYFSQANLLVLDEPTNFLDVETREIMEDVLSSYAGALVVVSHDRYLLQKISNRVIELDGKGIHELLK